MLEPLTAREVGAHTKDLEQSHNGPDVIENIWCLCRNHHEQFDSFSFYIDPMTLEIRNREGF